MVMTPGHPITVEILLLAACGVNIKINYKQKILWHSHKQHFLALNILLYNLSQNPAILLAYGIWVWDPAVVLVVGCTKHKE
jgi:hypothetical protein